MENSVHFHEQLGLEPEMSNATPPIPNSRRLYQQNGSKGMIRYDYIAWSWHLGGTVRG